MFRQVGDLGKQQWQETSLFIPRSGHSRLGMALTGRLPSWPDAALKLDDLAGTHPPSHQALRLPAGRVLSTD